MLSIISDIDTSPRRAVKKLLKLADRLQGERVNNDEDEEKIETENEEGGDDTFFSLVIVRANKRLDDAKYNMLDEYS